MHLLQLQQFQKLALKFCGTNISILIILIIFINLNFFFFLLHYIPKSKLLFY